MTGLAGLFLTGMLASTLLPLASEPVLLAYLAYLPQDAVWPPVLAMGLGNTLGGVITLMLGRGIRWLWFRRTEQDQTQKSSRTLAFVQRFGSPALVLSWLPVVGDPLVLVAGTLRLPVAACVFWITLGKFGRYAALVWLVPWW